MQKTEILIAGGGVAGLALAIRLRQLGFDPLVVEKQVGVRPQVKGEYFQPQGLVALQKIGLLGAFHAENSSRIFRCSHHYKSPLSKAPEVFRFTYNPAHEINYGIAVTHEEILRIMRAKYAELAGRLQEGTFIADLQQHEDGYSVDLSNGESFETEIFIGADGRYSPTRKLAGFQCHQYSTPRYMMATLVTGVEVPEHEFYTEEVSGGVIYAFAYPDQTVRAYLCFDESELEECQKDKDSFFLAKLAETSLPGKTTAKVIDRAGLMPTQDIMLEECFKGNGLWFGDAAGTVDPLGGHGMSVALHDSLRIASLIEDCLRNKTGIQVRFQEFSRISRQDYLHARFIGAVIALVFTGQSKIAKLMKHRAVLRYREDARLVNYLADMFGGLNKDRLTLYDLPYILGIIPSKTRRMVKWLKLDQLLVDHQNDLLLEPLYLKKHQLTNRLRSSHFNVFFSKISK